LDVLRFSQNTYTFGAFKDLYLIHQISQQAPKMNVGTERHTVRAVVSSGNQRKMQFPYSADFA